MGGESSSSVVKDSSHLRRFLLGVGEGLRGELSSPVGRGVTKGAMSASSPAQLYDPTNAQACAYVVLGRARARTWLSCLRSTGRSRASSSGCTAGGTRR
eukprot:9481390-Pyramimonas_sp.AAC.1